MRTIVTEYIALTCTAAMQYTDLVRCSLHQHDAILAVAALIKYLMSSACSYTHRIHNMRYKSTNPILGLEHSTRIKHQTSNIKHQTKQLAPTSLYLHAPHHTFRLSFRYSFCFKTVQTDFNFFRMNQLLCFFFGLGLGFEMHHSVLCGC